MRPMASGEGSLASRVFASMGMGTETPSGVGTAKVERGKRVTRARAVVWRFIVMI